MCSFFRCQHTFLITVVHLLRDLQDGDTRHHSGIRLNDHYYSTYHYDGSVSSGQAEYDGGSQE